MVIDLNKENLSLDMEWVELIMHARQMGFEPDEVKRVLQVLQAENAAASEETAV